jgi:hypothetical protein
LDYLQGVTDGDLGLCQLDHQLHKGRSIRQKPTDATFLARFCDCLRDKRLDLCHRLRRTGDGSLDLLAEFLMSMVRGSDESHLKFPEQVNVVGQGLDARNGTFHFTFRISDALTKLVGIGSDSIE